MKTRLLLLTAFLAISTMAMASDYTKYIKQAQNGDPIAQCIIGLCYTLGKGVKKDNAQAAYWFRKSAEQGYASAQANLGDLYYMGEGVEEDYAQAVYWWRKAAAQGEKYGIERMDEIGNDLIKKYSLDQNNQAQEKTMTAAEAKSKGAQYYEQKNYAEAFKYFKMAATMNDVESMVYTGYMCLNGLGGQKDSKTAVYWYSKAADKGNAEAQYRLGYCYSQGEGVAKDDEEAAYWWRKAADQGRAEGQYLIGICYYNGQGVKQNTEMAIYWWELAAKQGHEESQKLLAQYGQTDNEQADNEQQPVEELSEDEKLYAEYIKAAKQGDAEAQFKIGYCYDKGKGVSQDYVQAVFWYRKAAEQGHAKAQHSIGNCYDTGEGVDQDFVQAVYWYRKSAEQGFMKAYRNLVYCYFMGRGVAKDLTQAVYWCRKAAEQGDASSQCALGYFYFNGEGVTQDYAQAVAWFRKAADQGDENAKEFLSKAEDALKNQQLAEQNKQKQENLATIEWLNFASTVNQKEYQLKLGIKSSSKIEDVSITVNGSQSRGINTVKSDGYDQTINRTLALSEGTNNIVVSVRNADGTATSTKVVTYQANTAVQEVSQGKRIALVMGNSNYTNSSALKNPVNDATDVAKKLEALGFTVIRSLDQSKRGMETAINDFGVKAQGYDVALFFYAGHGISYKGHNYMIPVDANLAAEEDVEYDCTDASRVLAKMDKANCKMKIMILDACRDLPSFARGWHRSVGNSGGFNRMDAPRGTFIAYATAEGDVAQDGKGRNSPFTTALLETLDEPNLPLSLFFDRVTDKVVTTTNEKQNPWVSSSFRGKFIFNQK